ncbi:MAG: recombinase family protein [Clostridia bacterium]|nr:recombinase family protein [Clostridia bacterium]
MVEKFKIAAYTRISVDLELDRENTSIENQKAIIGEYCRLHFPTSSVDYYEDRDKSGYTFEQRTDYMRMREKLINHEYDILIVKDLSRFSRRTDKGLAEFEELSEHDVRIIAIGDGVDYYQDHIDDWMKIKLYFFVNEMPVTDTSRKVSDVIASRQSRGEWICSVPFGYMITNTKKMTFEVDEPSAEIVRRIFAYYIDGWGYKRIANHLTDEHIPTPRMREKARKEAQGDEYKGKVKEAWSVVTISEILCNDFYIGTLRQHKYKRKKINGDDIELDPTQHIVFENHHEAIIDYRTFAITQELLKKRSTSHYRGQKKYENNYSGYLFCGDCGSPMFSRSRPDLADAYICGTYHARGKAGCTTHHIRVDVLDRELKRYVARLCETSEMMLKRLEAEVSYEPSAVQDSMDAAEELAKLIEDEKEALKILMRQKTRDLARAKGNEDVIMEMYDGLIEETANRIHGLENQIAMTADTRNTIIRANRHAKAVLEIFRDLLSKEKLDKRDISLIVDRIIVYENRIDIKLRSDVDALLRCDDDQQSEDAANFNEDTKDIEKVADKYHSVAVQSAKNQLDKVFSVNVISGGDPLEIYTDREGEVIFKKYSPVGELSSFASQYADTLHKTCGLAVLISDRDAVIATAGVSRKEYGDKRLSPELEAIIEKRSLYVYKEGEEQIPVTTDSLSHAVSVAMPILSEGDLVGCVLSVLPREGEKANLENDIETKLIQTAAGFLGRQLEG